MFRLLSSRVAVQTRDLIVARMKFVTEWDGLLRSVTLVRRRGKVPDDPADDADRDAER